jgi:hypothetical protein
VTYSLYPIVYNLSIAHNVHTMEEMSIEDIMREIPPEDLHYVGSVKDRIYMPVGFVQKWVLPTIRVQKALKEYQDGYLRPVGHGLQ